jgi:DNA-binding LytR/AlgR family response regulator
MKPLICIAVDDEPHALELLEAYVDRVPFLTLVKTTNSPWEAMKTLQEEDVDLAFLDIQMDELTGLQMMNMGPLKCAVIITSAYSEYALDGFNHEVTDYLLKPYSFDRFLKAVNKVYTNQNSLKAVEKIDDSRPQVVTHIFIKGDAKNKYHQVKLADILYVEGLKNYVQFHCRDENIVTLQNMKDIELYLPANSFVRTHRSYIVNINAIEKVDGHTIYIGKKPISIGPSYREVFYRMIQDRQL